ncbi:MAG TPA: 50S ribosomal protein L25 [Chthonomonadaceae bacterium]|nr:50S ribosomal protein L25 [Chthonomonadaceae bacterium]
MPTQFALRPIEAATKGAVKQLRRDGFVPVSVQHRGMPTAHYQLETKPLDEFITRHGAASFVDLVTADKKHQRALISSVQRDPLTHGLLQVTFQQVRRDDRVKTQVPLHFTGEPEEVRIGAYITQHPIDSLEIECAADQMPAMIEVDISGLQPNHPLRVSDLPAHPHYRITAAADTTLASLSSTLKGIQEQEAETAAAEEANAAAAAAAPPPAE